MKSILTIIILFLCFACAGAQETKTNETPQTTTFEDLLRAKPQETADGKPQYQLGDECGNQAQESQLYDSRKGRIIEILSANKVLFEQDSVNGNEKKDKFTVKLVGIDANENEIFVKAKLQEILLNQEVEIYGNLRKKADKEFGGIVWHLGDNEDIAEVNTYLLENGIAKYEPFESANLVSMVMPCRLQKAEEKAKEAKLGIWAK